MVSALAPTKSGLVPATEGTGRLLQREYEGVIVGAKGSAEEVIDLLRRDLPLLVPSALASFEAELPTKRAVAVDDQFSIDIPMAGKAKVRVTEITPHTLTLETMAPHPEAGRISFAAVNTGANLTFTIRSRARASDLWSYLGYLVIGRYMQRKTWTICVERVAHAVGGRLVGKVRVRSVAVDEIAADRLKHAGSTFETLY